MQAVILHETTKLIFWGFCVKQQTKKNLINAFN